MTSIASAPSRTQYEKYCGCENDGAATTAPRAANVGEMLPCSRVTERDLCPATQSSNSSPNSDAEPRQKTKKHVAQSLIPRSLQPIMAASLKTAPRQPVPRARRHRFVPSPRTHVVLGSGHAFQPA